MDVGHYQQRLDELATLRREATTRDMQRRYQRAIDLSNAAAETWILLSDAALVEHSAYDEHAVELSQSIEQRAEKLAERASELVGRPEPTTEVDRNLSRIEVADLLIGLMTLGARATTLALTDTLHGSQAGAVTGLGNELFAGIFAPDASEFRKDVVVNGIEVAIGIVPVLGTAYDVWKRALERRAARRDRGRAADAEIAYLDGYCEALDCWCLAAEVVIRRLRVAEEGLNP